ncbi:shikimate dehydrogenase family protein [Altibacter lentus]|uniref:shikimate dehydrogenase family protein n=1 Tax=Altibacter lentus TaxID=1223410 RepID=UPI00055169CF|nr:shikimate dehydrogenase [Altibacter lentus]
MARYGLIGKNIAYSFSRTFFTYKFEKEQRPDTYQNFDIQTLEDFPAILKNHADLRGLNVTIPYKEAIIPYLDKVDKEAAAIGAVNTIKIHKDGSLVGYNTDHYGFAKALADLLPLRGKTALILGTGGASKAIAYVLKTMDFEYLFVSRTPAALELSYKDVTSELLSRYFLIINCTPLGTFPNTEAFPPLPYQGLTKDHVLFDLIYNPTQTEFMKRGFAKGARVSNGMKMLEYQAKKSWSIWKS